jgi:hypothetical protein
MRLFYAGERTLHRMPLTSAPCSKAAVTSKRRLTPIRLRRRSRTAAIAHHHSVRVRQIRAHPGHSCLLKAVYSFSQSDATLIGFWKRIFHMTGG